MKKLLVGTAAIALGLAVAAPAHAQLQLGVAGHAKIYADWDNQDTGNATGVKERHFDIIRDTEVHFTGETTLDNGLTVGVHVEAMADAGDSFAVDESYVYMSGYWGRVNVGDEDGSTFLLQVAAPSADSNVDGIRQYVNPVNYGITDLAGRLSKIDYANDATRHDDKLTYLSPVFAGFQVGVSYTPTVNSDPDNTFPAGYTGEISRTFGNSTKPAGAYFGNAYEGAARWEGTFRNVGLNLGGGYGRIEGENGQSNLNQWNLGADANLAAFGLGAVYSKDGAGSVFDGASSHAWDFGTDYTTGPFKFGASYLRRKDAAIGGDANGDGFVDGTTVAAGNVMTHRFSGGVVYTFAPGMSFRGSAGYIKSDVSEASDVDATYALLGTQINF